MQALALQLVLKLGNLAQQKDLLPWSMTPIPLWTPSFQHKKTEYFTVAAADLCSDVFVAIVYIHFSLWCSEVYWKNLVCKDLKRSGSKGRNTGETINAGNYVNFNGVS